MNRLKKATAVVLCTVLMVACPWGDTVLADINVLISIAGAIIPAVGQLSPADAAAAQKISQIASDAMVVIQKDYDAVKASGASSDLAILRATVNTLTQNLNQELEVIKVNNPALIGKVTAWVNVINVSLNAILSAFPQVAGGEKVSLKKLGKVPSPASIKLSWKNQVCAGDASCAALVK